MSMNLSDAEVTILSIPRRFAEALNGPTGDPAWERKLTEAGQNGASPVALGTRASNDLGALASMVETLTTVDTPAMTLSQASGSSGVDVAVIISALKAAASQAATALKSHDGGEFNRTVTVDSKQMTAKEAITYVAEHCIAGLKEATALLQ